MLPKPKILIVGNYNRMDVVNSFRILTEEFNLYFAEFTSQKEEQNDYYKTFGKAVYWSDYYDAFDLLSKVKPYKVIFIFIESYHHMAVNLACKQIGITTLIIDHGLRDPNINIRLAQLFTRPKKKILLLEKGLQLFSQFIYRFKARLFVIRTSRNLKIEFKLFFIQFRKIRSNHDYEKTIVKVNSPLCLPDRYVSFSNNNKKGHFPFYLFPNQYISSIIGIPLFDSLSGIKPKEHCKREVLFIDQGLNNRNLLGWNDSNYLNFLSNLSVNTNTKGIKFYFKSHPTQTIDQALFKNNCNFEIIDDHGVKKVLSNLSVVVGFFSTYLLPLAALPHTTIITLENHPIGKYDVSKSFIDAGVAHPVYTLDELLWALENAELLHEKQLQNKKKFEQDWLYKFDGKSGERLREVLLSDLK